jgi:type I restriction enzyme S subunit
MKWAVQKLEEIVSIKTGKLDSNAAVPNGQYPFFTCDPQTLAINTYAYDTEAVLLAGNNASGNYTAKYYHGKFNAYQRTYIIESIDKGKLDIHYFLYALNEQLALLKSISSGSTTKFLTMSMLKPLSVPCPTISVQHRIASILSAYDDLIENNRRQIKLLEEAAQRLYREWFVELRFPGHEGVKVMDGVPEGWKIETVGSLLRKIPRTKQILTSDYQVSGNIPIVDQSRDFIAGYTNDTDACVKPQDAIIVFGDHTRILKYITFPFAKGADGTQLIVSNSDCMPQSLFYFSIIHIDLTNYHYARHFKYLKESTILVPTKSIANAYDNIVHPIMKRIQVLRDSCVKAKEARDRLLPILMNREMEVSE